MSIREVFGYRWDTAYPFEPVRGTYLGRRRGHQAAPPVVVDEVPDEEQRERLELAQVAQTVGQLGLSL